MSIMSRWNGQNSYVMKIKVTAKFESQTEEQVVAGRPTLRLIDRTEGEVLSIV